MVKEKGSESMLKRARALRKRINSAWEEPGLVRSKRHVQPASRGNKSKRRGNLSMKAALLETARERHHLLCQMRLPFFTAFAPREAIDMTEKPRAVYDDGEPVPSCCFSDDDTDVEVLDLEEYLTEKPRAVYDDGEPVPDCSLSDNETDVEVLNLVEALTKDNTRRTLWPRP